MVGYRLFSFCICKSRPILWNSKQAAWPLGSSWKDSWPPKELGRGQTGEQRKCLPVFDPTWEIILRVQPQCVAGGAPNVFHDIFNTFQLRQHTYKDIIRGLSKSYLNSWHQDVNILFDIFRSRKRVVATPLYVIGDGYLTYLNPAAQTLKSNNA